VTTNWKAGRGTLGALAPLLGAWVAEGDSPAGPYRCERRFERVLGGKWIGLRATWTLPGRTYDEQALFGAGAGRDLRFWSFTSDGKRSEGVLAAVDDLPQPCVAFEADMPAGRARFAYWPGEDGSVQFAVESRTKRGWNRFVEHTYRALD
jgi:hypothetical protein